MIADAAEKLKKKYDETDPWKLASAMNIQVSLVPMGLFEGCCKGFFLIHKRIKHITIKSDLPEEYQRVILAHELAHLDSNSKKESANALFSALQLTDIKKENEESTSSSSQNN